MESNDSLDYQLTDYYASLGRCVDYQSLNDRLRTRLIKVSKNSNARSSRRVRPSQRVALTLALAALLVCGGAVAVAAHVVPDDLPPSLATLLGDHLPLGTVVPVTHAKADIWIVSLPCEPTASKSDTDPAWRVVNSCQTPYTIQPQIPSSVGSVARWNVLMMIAMQYYQGYWSAHPGWTQDTAPQIDARARMAVAQALNDYLDGRVVTIRDVNNGPVRNASDVERELMAADSRSQ